MTVKMFSVLILNSNFTLVIIMQANLDLSAFYCIQKNVVHYGETVIGKKRWKKRFCAFHSVREGMDSVHLTPGCSKWHVQITKNTYFKVHHTIIIIIVATVMFFVKIIHRSPLNKGFFKLSVMLLIDHLAYII